MGRGLAAVFAFVLLAGLVSAQVANKVVLKDFRVEGDAEPGGELTVFFKLRNIYAWELKDVNVQLDGSYPFLAASPVSVGYESKVLPYTDSKAFSYSLNIDKAARAGDYSFNILVSFSAFTYNTESQPFSNVIPVTLKVFAPPDVGAGLSGSDPAELSEGQSVVLNVKVWNQGSGGAKNVWLAASGTDELDVAFASRRIYLGDIESKGARNVGIAVSVGDGVPPALYSLPFTLEYEGDNGSSYAKSGGLGVEVKKTANFEITGVRQGELIAGQKDRLVELTVRNKGTKAASDLRLTLLAKYPFTPTGKTYYLDGLAPGESKVASFHVDIDEQAAVQNYPADLQVEWKENEKEKSSLERFSLKTSPKRDVQQGFWEKLVVQQDARLLAGIGGLLLFFVILFFFKKVR